LDLGCVHVPLTQDVDHHLSVMMSDQKIYRDVLTQ
jgi:hypothetical protein